MCRQRKIDDDKYIEECLSDNMNYDIIRIFDVNLTVKWPPISSNSVVGGYHLMRIPYIPQERMRNFYTDEQMPVTRYSLYDSVNNQRNVIIC